MANKLKEEIKQNKPFSGLEQEAILNIHRTSGYISHLISNILKHSEITNAQYNVLRILRGAGARGLRCSEIGERMVSREPDITRLLGRLRVQGLVLQNRDPGDRRVVYTMISEAGLKALEELDPVIEGGTASMLLHMDHDRLGLLIDLLEEVRQGVAA